MNQPAAKKRKALPTVWRIATTVPLRRGIVVLSCLLLSGLLEAVGIASLLPLVALGSGQSESFARIAKIIEKIGLPQDPRWLLLLLVVGMLGKAAMLLLAMRQVGYAAAEVGTRMRMRLIDALLEARWGFFVRQPVGRFANALSLEATRAGEAYNILAQFGAHVVQAVVYVAAMAIGISWELAGAALLISLIMALSLNRLLSSSKRNARKQTRRMKVLISRLADVLVGLKPIKAMGRHARFGSLFRRDVDVIDRAMRKHVFAQHANRVLQEPITAICVGVGVYLAFSVWQLDIGTVVIMCVLLAKAVSTMGKAQQDWQMLQLAKSGFGSIQSAIDEAVEAQEVVTRGKTPTFERDIELNDVSMSFGAKRVIANANGIIPQGAVTAITGHSGAGKTTLVDIILGLYWPDAGEVRIDGVSLRELDIMQWRSMVGYVPQELLLYHDTIATNVTLGDPALSRADVETALRQAGAWDFVAQLPDGIDHVVGERGALLSGGQRQRIAMARALVHKPKLLILDEATSALDPNTEATIVRNVRDLAHATSLTVLAITHQPAWVAAADKVIRIEDGAVRELAPAPRRVSAE